MDSADAFPAASGDDSDNHEAVQLASEPPADSVGYRANEAAVGSDERPQGRLQQVLGRAAAPLAGAASGALGGALGVAAVASGGALGALAAVALAGTLVSAASRSQAQEQEVPAAATTEIEFASQGEIGNAAVSEGEQPSAERGQLDVNHVPPSEDGGTSSESTDTPRQEVSNPAPAELAEPEAEAGDADFAQTLLAGSELLPLARLLHRLHDRNPAHWEQVCYEEGLERLPGNGERVLGFLQRGADGGDAKVFVLGSEVDAVQRPEAFLECWVQTNAQISLQDLDSTITADGEGRVHQGFQAAWLSIAPAVRRLNDSRKVTFLGYSLGGALATLAALDLCCKGFTQVELITFGSPRVGNERFRDFFRETCLATGALRVARFVNTLDLVPHVPFNPADAVDATRPGRLWQSVEETLMHRLPQERLTGAGLGSYVHVFPATVLDGLSAGLGGVAARLAAVAPGTERGASPTSMAASLPLEFLSEHSLRSYLRTLEAAPKPAWLAVSSLLLDSARPLRTALVRLGQPRGGGIAEAASAASVGVSVGTMLVPHLLGASISAVGCFYVAQQVSRVSQELHTHSADTTGRLESLGTAVRALSQEVRDAGRTITAGFADLSALLQRQNVDGILRRARAGQKQLADDLEVFLAHPSTDHVLMIREGSRELRGVLAEVLELSAELEEAGASAASSARLLEVLLSGTRLALLADSLIDEESAALRAAQALSRLAPTVGRFYWQHMAVSAAEQWQEAVEVHRLRFMAVALAVAARPAAQAENPLSRLTFGSPPERLFAALSFEPRSAELRVSLALHFAARNLPANQVVLPAQPWMAITDVDGHGDTADTDLFLRGLSRLLPVPGCQMDPASAALVWNRLVLEGADLASSLKSLDVDEDRIPESTWRALADATKAQQLKPLALALHSSFALPGTVAQDLQAWLSRFVTVEDLEAAQGSVASFSAQQQMANALVHDTRGREDLLQKSRDVFEDLTSMLQMAMAHLSPADQQDLDEVRSALDKDLDALNVEARYLVLGGLVSAGKTSLVNALLLQAMPSAREELKEDRVGRLNLMPTSFNENTRIVTQLELNPWGTSIEIHLLETVFETASDEMSTQEVGAEIHQTGGQSFRLCEGYPVVLTGPRPLRKLQKHLHELCAAEVPIGTHRRLRVVLPSPQLDRTLSIIDTPGLDSPFVWRQVADLVESKASVFVWVAALDSVSAFGLQGHHLLELHRRSGNPLPPILVLTKWDRLKTLPEFMEDPTALASQARQRLAQLRSGVAPCATRRLRCQSAADVESVISALAPCWQAGEAGALQHWHLARPVVIAGQTLPCHAVLQIDDNDNPEASAESTPANVAEYLRSLPLPASICFRHGEGDAPLLLAATNASSALEVTKSSVASQASESFAKLWSTLLLLMSGVSEPLRINRRLAKIVVATQQAVNILLKDDEQATVFPQRGSELLPARDRVVQGFRERLEGYFQGLPARPEDLENYTPPAGLEREECATCLIGEFLAQAHDATKEEKNQFRYVKATATMVLERWQGKFIENMMRLEQQCLVDLQRQISELMQTQGLIQHNAWDTSVRGLVAPSLEALRAGGLGYVVGVFFEVSVGASLGLGLPLGVAFAVAALFGQDSELGRNLGLWSHADGQRRVLKAVLDNLNRPDFQAQAKEVILQEFERRLASCMEQLAGLRDPSQSSRNEAQAATSIQARIAALQRSLAIWFNHFLSDRLGQDPWLIPPPVDLQEALDSRTPPASDACSSDDCEPEEEEAEKKSLLRRFRDFFKCSLGSPHASIWSQKIACFIPPSSV